MRPLTPTMTTQGAINLGVRIVTRTKYVVAGLLFCLLTPPPSRAQITVDVSKITCKEFLHDTVTVPNNIAYWLSGYYNGKRDSTVFDVNGLKDYVSKVENYCIENQDVTVMEAVQTLVGVSR
jgi:acid stress chaperone HdeB